MCKNLLRDPCETEYMCFCSLLWHLNLYSRLSLDFSKHASFPLGWEGESLVAISYSSCQLFCQSYQTGRPAVTLNQNISPILKYLNQMLEALRVCLQALGIRRWRAEPAHKHRSLLSCLDGGRLLTQTRTRTQTHTPLPEPAPWAWESMPNKSGTSYAIHTSERQTTEKGWPWVEWPDVSLYFLSNPRELRDFFICVAFLTKLGFSLTSVKEMSQRWGPLEIWLNWCIHGKEDG